VSHDDGFDALGPGSFKDGIVGDVVLKVGFGATDGASFHETARVSSDRDGIVSTFHSHRKGSTQQLHGRPTVW